MPKIKGADIGNGEIRSQHLDQNALVWTNRPAFLVGWNGSVSLSTTPVIIPLNGTISLNRGNCLDTTNNRFVCPAAGLYMFGYSYLRNPSAVVVRANLYKNGVSLQQQLRSAEGFTGYNYTAGQWQIAYAEVGDYFDLRISADSATTLYNDGGGLSYNWFCGYIVG